MKWTWISDHLLRCDIHFFREPPKVPDSGADHRTAATMEVEPYGLYLFCALQ